MVGGGGVGPKSVRVAGVGCHLSWGHWHGDTLPVLRWAIWVEEQVCPQGPGGGLGPGGITSCPEGRAGRPGVSPSQEASGQGSGLLCRGLHPENQEVRCRDQLEVVLCLPCPGVTGTSSFMPRVG